MAKNIQLRRIGCNKQIQNTNHISCTNDSMGKTERRDRNVHIKHNHRQNEAAYHSDVSHSTERPARTHAVVDGYQFSNRFLTTVNRASKPVIYTLHALLSIDHPNISHHILTISQLTKHKPIHKKTYIVRPFNTPFK
uniref:Uncharacterized protein n=1 Tax=Parascaris univalens TaxID=6257 RepID=A0A915AIY4_PARUN